jgi:general secretion pathway protein D
MKKALALCRECTNVYIRLSGEFRPITCLCVICECVFVRNLPQRILASLKYANAIVLVAMFLATAGCSQVGDLIKANTIRDPSETVPGDPSETVANTNFTPRFVASNRNGGRVEAAPTAVIYEPDGSTAANGQSPGRAQATQVPGKDAFQINFENASVPTVARTLLGDILHATYVIDQRVQGTVNIASSTPIPRKEILALFEAALRSNNAALIKDGPVYRIVPVTEALGASGVTDSGDAGYGISVVPIHNTSARALAKLVDGFAAKAGSVRPDTARNALIIQGTSTERANLEETIASFDQPWLRDQSIGIFPLQNSPPDTVIAELEKIIEAKEGGASADVIKFQPIARMNAILVIAKHSSFLQLARTWITRLDRNNVNATNIRIYRVRYGEAKQIAAVLNEVFLGRQANLGDRSIDQIAPGSSGFRSRLDSTNQTGNDQARTNDSNRTQTGGPTQNAALLTPAKSTTDNQSTAGASNLTGASEQAPLRNVRITADTNNNSLIIYASREDYQLIEKALMEIDRSPLQVAIEATVAEVTLNDNMRGGVQYMLRNFATGSAALVTGAGTATAAGTVISRTLPGASILLGAETDPKVIIEALREKTNVNIISSPSLVVLNNQPAVLQVGDEVPVTTSSATVLSSNNTVVNNVVFKNTGVILKILPRINENGMIVLDIEQEISQIVQNVNSTTLTPTISQRRVRSSIGVVSGQSVLLAGLISERRERDKSGVPLLSDISTIGDLFAKKTATSARTEIIIFIRPQIIRNGADHWTVTEELRSRLFSMQRRSATNVRPAQ